MNKTPILFAPLQGFTDAYYRNAHHKVIGGVDEYYAPYLRLDNNKELSAKQIKDIDPKHNTAKVIPQILVNNADDFIYLEKLLYDFGYSELNLNLGCPYPMVTNRNLGSGLLPQTTSIINMLDKSLAKANMKVSIKMRLGLDEPTDVFTLLPLFNQFDLAKIIIHPRIARKLYKGNADVDAFVKCKDYSKHTLVYNGDIVDLNTHKQLVDKIGNSHEVMIGRGLLSDVFLGKKLKGEQQLNDGHQNSTLMQFHNEVFEAILSMTSGFTHAHNKLLQFWTYFAFHFDNPKKIIKLIKKCKSEATYLSQTASIFSQQ